MSSVAVAIQLKSITFRECLFDSANLYLNHVYNGLVDSDNFFLNQIASRISFLATPIFIAFDALTNGVAALVTTPLLLSKKYRSIPQDHYLKFANSFLALPLSLIAIPINLLHRQRWED